jgi:hypothetical protein
VCVWVLWGAKIGFEGGDYRSLLSLLGFRILYIHVRVCACVCVCVRALALLPHVSTLRMYFRGWVGWMEDGKKHKSSTQLGNCACLSPPTTQETQGALWAPLLLEQKRAEHTHINPHPKTKKGRRRKKKKTKRNSKQPSLRDGFEAPCLVVIPGCYRPLVCSLFAPHTHTCKTYITLLLLLRIETPSSFTRHAHT